MKGKEKDWRKSIRVEDSEWPLFFAIPSANQPTIHKWQTRVCNCSGIFSSRLMTDHDCHHHTIVHTYILYSSSTTRWWRISLHSTHHCPIAPFRMQFNSMFDFLIWRNRKRRNEIKMMCFMYAHTKGQKQNYSPIAISIFSQLEFCSHSFCANCLQSFSFIMHFSMAVNVGRRREDVDTFSPF